MLRHLIRSATSHCSCASGLKPVQVGGRGHEKDESPHTKHTVSSGDVLVSLCVVCPHSGSRTGKRLVAIHHSTISIQTILQ